MAPGVTVTYQGKTWKTPTKSFCRATVPPPSPPHGFNSSIQRNSNWKEEKLSTHYSVNQRLKLGAQGYQVEFDTYNPLVLPPPQAGSSHIHATHPLKLTLILYYIHICNNTHKVYPLGNDPGITRWDSPFSFPEGCPPPTPVTPPRSSLNTPLLSTFNHNYF
jgi:hypothetical protein